MSKKKKRRVAEDVQLSAKSKKRAKKKKRKRETRAVRKVRPVVHQTGPDRSSDYLGEVSENTSAYKVDPSLLDEGRVAARAIGSTAEEAVTAGYAFLDEFLHTYQDGKDPSLDMELVTKAIEKVTQFGGNSAELGGGLLQKWVKLWFKLLVGGYAPMSPWLGNMSHYAQSAFPQDIWNDALSAQTNFYPQSSFSQYSEPNGNGESSNLPGVSSNEQENHRMPNPALPVHNAAAFLGRSVNDVPFGDKPHDFSVAVAHGSEGSVDVPSLVPTLAVARQSTELYEIHCVQLSSYPSSQLSCSMPLSLLGEPCPLLLSACSVSYDVATRHHKLRIERVEGVAPDQYRFNLLDGEGRAFALVSVAIHG